MTPEQAANTIQELKARATHLLKRSESLSHEAHQLRLILAGLCKLRRFVED